MNPSFTQITLDAVRIAHDRSTDTARVRDLSNSHTVRASCHATAATSPSATQGGRVDEALSHIWEGGSWKNCVTRAARSVNLKTVNKTPFYGFLGTRVAAVAESYAVAE